MKQRIFDRRIVRQSRRLLNHSYILIPCISTGGRRPLENLLYAAGGCGGILFRYPRHKLLVVLLLSSSSVGGLGGVTGVASEFSDPPKGCLKFSKLLLNSRRSWRTLWVSAIVYDHSMNMQNSITINIFTAITEAINGRQRSPNVKYCYTSTRFEKLVAKLSHELKGWSKRNAHEVQCFHLSILSAWSLNYAKHAIILSVHRSFHEAE